MSVVIEQNDYGDDDDDDDDGDDDDGDDGVIVVVVDDIVDDDDEEDEEDEDDDDDEDDYDDDGDGDDDDDDNDEIGSCFPSFLWFGFVFGFPRSLARPLVQPGGRLVARLVASGGFEPPSAFASSVGRSTALSLLLVFFMKIQPIDQPATAFPTPYIAKMPPGHRFPLILSKHLRHKPATVFPAPNTSKIETQGLNDNYDYDGDDISFMPEEPVWRGRFVRTGRPNANHPVVKSTNLPPNTAKVPTGHPFPPLPNATCTAEIEAQELDDDYDDDDDVSFLPEAPVARKACVGRSCVPRAEVLEATLERRVVTQTARHKAQLRLARRRERGRGGWSAIFERGGGGGGYYQGEGGDMGYYYRGARGRGGGALGCYVHYLPRCAYVVLRTPNGVHTRAGPQCADTFYGVVVRGTRCACKSVHYVSVGLIVLP